ncbi:MAG: hypothetical protein JO069_06790 [Verrucomicrobia bacterium]|nr:hypothetical protein [Verrucomicrobiota bacterium]
MEIDTRFPTRLNTASDAPEPLRSALMEDLPSGKPVRLLLHAPAFETGEGTSPATVLAVTDTGWLVVSEAASGGVAAEKSGFDDTLFLQLTPILLLDQLKIAFVATGTPRAVTMKFETVGDDLYREAIDLILAGIDPALTAAADEREQEALRLEDWPLKIRNEAHRFWPKGQRLMTAIHWPAVFDGSRQQLAPAGALLITERELVIISDERKPLTEVAPAEEVEESFAGIVTFIPRARLAEYRVSHQQQSGVLVLQVKAAHGGEQLEVAFPSDEEETVSRAMRQMLQSRDSAEPTR